TVADNQTITELDTLVVTNTATDSDLPANTLTFSLVSPPAGMIIDPSSGVLTWTPTEAQGPSTNAIRVKVTDNGTPALSDTKGFITLTPKEADGPCTNMIMTVVTDNGVPPLSATNSLMVSVNEANSAPVLRAQITRTLAEQTVLTVTNTATDADIPVNVLTYQ